MSVKKKLASFVKNYGKTNFLCEKLHKLVPSSLERLTPFEIPPSWWVYLGIQGVGVAEGMGDWWVIFWCTECTLRFVVFRGVWVNVLGAS